MLVEDNSVNAASGSPREQKDDGVGSKDAEASTFAAGFQPSSEMLYGDTDASSK
jgi:hypothetical protein